MPDNRNLPASVRSLNPQQRDAVLTTEGALLILAGAGTGKTRVVTERIAHLLRNGVKPENILAVTFTNKAAGEMRERVAKTAGKRNDLKDLIISTFHSLCVRILRKDAQEIGYGPDFSICDQGEQIGMIRKASRCVNGVQSLKPDDLLYEIGKLKNKGITQEQMLRSAVDDWEMSLASVYRRYQQALKSINAFDFDDLMLKTQELFDTCPQALERWQDRFRYILVDEFQDTNHVQFRLVQTLTQKHRNICVVGDDDQSIYGWRGAVAGNILDFHKHFPGVKTIRLEQNYRSVSNVLKAANALIANNQNRNEKNLWSNLGEGEPIKVWIAEDQQNEAERVASDIHRRVRDDNSKFADFAVILRTNAQTRPFEDEFRAAQIPYTLIGGSSFFDRKEVRDILSYLSAVASSKADGSLLRIINVPARGIGERTVEAISKYAANKSISVSKAVTKAGEIDDLSAKAKESVSVFAHLLSKWRVLAREGRFDILVDTIIRDSNYAEEIEHLYDDPMERASRLNMAQEVGDSLNAYLRREPDAGLIGFLQEAMLMGKDDQSEKEKEKGNSSVKIITAHSAKGLEFPHVYIAGVEEGLMPHKNSEEENNVDEERRLCYVAITRAQRTLVMSRCRERVSRGKRTPREPSRFFLEIPKELMICRDDVAQKEEISSTIAEIMAKLNGG